jgi:hypothetical protein
MVDDIEGFIEDMRRGNIDVSEAQDRGWGVLTQLTLPGGGAISVYEPRHERPSSMPAGSKRHGGSRKTKKVAGKKRNAAGKKTASRRATASKKPAKKRPGKKTRRR